MRRSFSSLALAAWAARWEVSSGCPTRAPGRCGDGRGMSGVPWTRSSRFRAARGPRRARTARGTAPRTLRRQGAGPREPQVQALVLLAVRARSAKSADRGGRAARARGRRRPRWRWRYQKWEDHIIGGVPRRHRLAVAKDDRCLAWFGDTHQELFGPVQGIEGGVMHPTYVMKEGPY